MSTSGSDSSDSDYDRKQRQKKKGITSRISGKIKRKKKIETDDGNDDYERYHRKNRKSIRSPISDTEDKKFPKKNIKKKSQSSESEDQSSLNGTESEEDAIPPPKRSRKPKRNSVQTPKSKTKKAKKDQRTRSAKRQSNSVKKNGSKDQKPNTAKKAKKEKVKTKTASKSKKTDETKNQNSKSKKKLKSQRVPQIKPLPIRKNKRKLRKAQTMTEREMNINTADLLRNDNDDDSKFEVGNDVDLASFALNAEMRAKIKANKNRTYGGFRVKINYRYRLNDNRIGICRFSGIPLFAKNSEEWIGLVIEHNGTGENDGSVQNKSYFRCRDGKGLFVRPYKLIEDLGINTRALTKEEIAGSQEIKQLIKDIKSGKKPPAPTTPKVETVKLKSNKPKKTKATDDFRRTKLRKKKGLKSRSKTETNLEKGGWKPPQWMDEIDKDHGYDFLSDRPYYGKDFLKKHKYKNKPVSVTDFKAKNNY